MLLDPVANSKARLSEVVVISRNCLTLLYLWEELLLVTSFLVPIR